VIGGCAAPTSNTSPLRNRVYLHEYILTVADIFEAPPNDISSPSEILQKEHTHKLLFII
jgi:hypothetical protein